MLDDNNQLQNAQNNELNNDDEGINETIQQKEVIKQITKVQIGMLHVHNGPTSYKQGL